MSRIVFVIGEAGAGKSSSMRNFNPKSTFLVNALDKELPWRGSAKQYTQWAKDKNPSGNVVKTSQSQNIVSWLDYVDKNRPEITDIVIDDNTFVTSLELLRRSKETTWDKYTDIASNFISLINKAKTLRPDLVVYFLHHTQVQGDGLFEEKKIRAMSYGKLIDEKLMQQESQFTVVLRAAKEATDDNIEYIFYTRDANSTVKTPVGMFEDAKIPNDLTIVRKAMDCYYDDNCGEEQKAIIKN